MKIPLEKLPEYIELIKDELNVKDVVFDSSMKEEVALDTTITFELKQEGNLRELTRTIQNLRKEAGLKPFDEIEIIMETDVVGKKFISEYKSILRKAVNAQHVSFSDNAARPPFSKPSAASFRFFTSERTTCKNSSSDKPSSFLARLISLF